MEQGGIPLFEKEGLGEILEGYVWLIMGPLVMRIRSSILQEAIQSYPAENHQET